APDQAGEAPAVDAAPAAAAPAGAPTTPHEATPPEATPEPPQEPSPAEEAKESPSWGPPASPLAHAAPEAASLSLGPPPEAPEAPTETPEGVAEDQAIRDAFTKGAATRRERGRTP